MHPVALRTSAIMLTLIMVLMPLTPFADQEFKSGDQVEETLDEEIIMSSGNTGNADSLAFGLQSGCAIGASGNIKCWGGGSDGQLGLGNTQNIGDSIEETGTNLPFVNLGTNASVDKIVMGESHSCALFTNGSVKCWGESSVLGLGYSSSNGGFGDGYLETGDTLPFIQFPTGRTATMIEAGKSHTCAVMDNNDLICWGDNSKGQLGLGDTDKRGDSAGEIGTNFAVTSVPTGRTVDSLGLGWDHTCAIWDNASVSCWGGNDNGQLGLDSTTYIGDGSGEMGDNLAFVTLPYSATQITSGDGFTCAVLQETSTKGVYCWGLNDYGQLGVESTTSVGDGAGTSMSSITETDLSATDILALDAGEDHVCAIIIYSSWTPVKCWGNGADGRLGYGSQDPRGTGPGSTSGMGSNLGYVRLTSSSNHFAVDTTDIEVGSGTTCVILNIGDVICWGSNGIGQLGYGDTEDRGDGQTDLPFTTELALGLNDEAMLDSCNILGVPEHRDELDRRLDSDSSDTGDLISMVEIPTTGCPAIAYYDSDSENVKFAAYDNGMWAVETLGSDSGVIDVDIVMDSDGNPHIVHMTSSGTDRVSYTTKINGIWTENTLTGIDGTEELSLSIDSDGDLRLLTLTTTELVEYECSGSCNSISSWSNSNTLVASGVSVVDSVGDHATHVTSSGLYYLESLGATTLVSTDVSSAYMATSMDIAPDGTISIAHTNDAYQAYYSSCSASCTSTSSWSTSLITNDSASEVALQIDADGTPWVLLTHNTTGATLFDLDNGQWDGQAISAWPGAADSFGMMINSAGYVYTSLHLVNPGELWAVTNPVVVGAGLYVDADGDGWTGMKEISCGTDLMDSSSTPSDFDQDGRCDSMDTINNLPSVGDSSVLTQGMDFACAILDDDEIYCWGDNAYGKLGGSASGVSWPTGFEAVDIDAGENHACALSSTGDILCWGRNNNGQIGTGAITTSEDPTLLTLPNNHLAADLAVGANHNCVTTTTSQIYCWGDGEDSQTGEYYVTDASAGYDDDFESTNPSSIWTIEGSAGQFGTQWTIDTNDASSGTNSFKSNGHGSSSDVGFSITSQFQSGMVSFDYKTDTCPTLSGCNDRLSFSIDGIEVNSSKGQMSNWSTYNTNITTGMHTLRWSFIKDGSAVNDANGDYVGVDDIQIRTGFRIESGGIIESPGIMNLDAGGLPQSITAGERHTCVTNHLNDVYCMGYNGGSSRMVLGNSSTTGTNSSSLVKVDVDFGTSSARTVTTGYDTSCAIMDSSTAVVCWGQRDDWSDSGGTTRSGELLLGSSSPSNDGTDADLGTAGDRIYSIAMGESHACAVVENTIECWGVEESGSFGQGSGSTGPFSTPQVTSVPSGLIAKQVVIEHSTDSTCGVFEDSTGTSIVICWGDDTAVGYSTSGAVTTLADAPVEDSNGYEISLSDSSQSPYDIVDIQSGSESTCALSRQGLIKCWGSNVGGRLGVPNIIGNNAFGDQTGEMGVNLQYVHLGDNVTATQMSVGYDHACAIVQSNIDNTINGKVMCWGYNNVGQANYLGATYIYTPLIQNDFGNDTSQIAAAKSTTCALKTNGEIYCIGTARNRAIGSSSTSGGSSVTTKLEYASSGKFIDLYASSASEGAFCATSIAGTIKCWGVGSYISQTSADPVQFYDFNGILPSDLSFGNDFACLVVASTTELHEATSPSTNLGDIVCWGSGSYGQLGSGSSSYVGTTLDIQTAKPIDFNGTKLFEVESSQDHSCALSISGEVYCWGRSWNGRLGHGNTGSLGDSVNELPFLTPVDLDGDAKLLSVTAAASCVVMTDNEVYCWGAGGYGITGHENSDDIGDQVNEMGVHLSPTDLHMRPTDYDLDGIIDHWDTDDDNDGTLDTNDDFRLDPCAAIDSDDDGMPNLVYSNCTTNLVEDLDDDNDLWNDTDEVACLTNPIVSTSIPFDTDSDGICDYIDTDDDNDGWSDIDEQLCEKKEWNTRIVHASTSSGYYHKAAMPKGITFLPNNGIYTFQLQGIDMQYSRLQAFEFSDTATGTTGHSRRTIVDSDTSYGFDYQTYGQGVYTVSSKEVWYSEYNTAAPNPTYGNTQVYAFNSSEQNNQHNMVVSEDGNVYLTTSDSIVQIEKGHLGVGWNVLGDLVSYIQYPDGVLNSTTGYGLGAYKQIEVDSNGNIHLLALHNEANRIYTWIYDIATDSWNSGLDSFPGTNGSIQPGRSSLSLDSSNQPHVVLMKGSTSTSADSSISYTFYDNTAQNWVERFSDGTPSGNYGVNLELDSNDDIHIAWVDRSNLTVYYTFLSGSTNQQSTTGIITFSGSNVASEYDVGLALDNGNDPWVYVNPYLTGPDARSSRVAYFGSQNDNSTESTLYPSDYDGDGTCDMLEIATLEYLTEGSNATGLIFEMEMDVSYIPDMPKMDATSVSISPALPAGLTLDNITGEISGRVLSTDFTGTVYTISTTSAAEPWSTNLTIKSMMEGPLYTGYQNTLNNDYSYTTSTKTAFAGNGETVTLERYQSSTSIMIDGVASGGNHDLDDIVLSMKDPTNNYIWAKGIRGNNFAIGDVDVDDNGNIYALFHAYASTNDPVEFNFEGVSIATGKYSVILAKWDYYGNLQWAINSDSSGTVTSDSASIQDSDTVSNNVVMSEMDLDKSTGDIAIIAEGKSTNDDLKFGGMQVGPFGTCLTTEQPWTAKVNSNGQVQWTAIGTSDPTSCKPTDHRQIVLHHDGSVTTAGYANGVWDYNFDSHSVESDSSTAYSVSWIAHADSSGNWAWAENISSVRYTGSGIDLRHSFTMDKFSDDTLFFAYTDTETSYCIELDFAGTKVGGIAPPWPNSPDCLITATMSHATSNVISTNYQLSWESYGNPFHSYRVHGKVDSNDIAHIVMDISGTSSMPNLRSIGYNSDLEITYSIVSGDYGNPYTTDFGLDNADSIFIVGYHNDRFLERSATQLNDCGFTCVTGVHATLSMPGSPNGIYRFWSDFNHEVNDTSPSEGVNTNLELIGYHGVYFGAIMLNDSQGNTNNAALPCGLSFGSTGTISGIPTPGCTDTTNETYTITVNYGGWPDPTWHRNTSFEVTFGIGPAVPVVSYNLGDTTQTYTRGTTISPIGPTAITNPANLHHFTTYPPLPAGLQVNSTGHIIGTPTVNQSTNVFMVKSCNSWNACSTGVPFTITINEPAPVISFADSEYEFYKDVPITPVVPTSTGGVASSWEIAPDLPTGLSLRGDGAIIGIPFVDSPATNYTIWANNTGGSGTVVLEITVNGTGVFITYPYNTAELAQYSPMMALYPSTSGAAVVSWSIEPTLPSGIFFGTSNGTIYGTPSTLTDSTVYTINASGIEDYGTATVTMSVLLDTDQDGIPDVNDDDIDNDGWSNIDETNCQTDEMDESDYPSDIDQDRICDLLDNSDDRSIIVIYLRDNVELANDSAMSSLIPITAGGDIDTWEIYPALPLGLEFNGTMPGRSTSDTGTISGTPTELSPATVYTIWANNTNSGQVGSFQITLSVLLDTDGDGTPNVYDDDIDGDNWSNEMENLCGEDPIDASSTPIDTDGDGLCNYIDSDDDNDSFIDTEEIMCNSNTTDSSSVPIDADNDGICDALQSDRDLDGWADGPEESCGSDPDNASSMPVDSDGDMICDVLDDDRDGDGVGNNVDDFPDDRSAAKDTDGDGKPDSIVGVSETGLIEDYDDDNDNWSDYDESVCGTDPLDDSEFPVDSDGDGICDALEEDTDGDGVVDAEDAFPMDKDEWLDTDGDGVGDNADEDDDGDTWSDADEDRCESDPLDSQSIPAELDENGDCITTKSEPPKPSDDDSSSSTMWWLLVCLPLLLLLLLIPLIYWSRARGDSLLVLMGMRNGPEPENTTANPGFVNGMGTKDEPFVLKTLHIKNFGDGIESKETITITNLDPDTMISITDMASHTNRGRFNMDPIHVEGNVSDKGNGSVVFRLNFDDNVTEDDISGVYQGQIRVGSSSVYILWDVKVGDPEADELAIADKKAKESKAQEETEMKAIKEAEAKDKADKKATDKKIKEAEEKAAAAEAKAAAAEDKAASEKKARENAEDSARVVAEQAAKERLEQMDKEMEVRRAKLDEMDEETRKREEELLRISEKAKTIDFATLGVATSDQKDDLQRIKGVGPFIEDKLNALGIYTFEQVGNMTSKIEEQVNVAIEFFSGRIKRDKWANQAKQFSKKK